MPFKNGNRILVFTDMSTECDDECALLWLLAALNRRGLPVTVELVHTDSYVRLQWMAHILRDKFAQGGEWRLQDGNSSFLVGNVLVNMYLAYSEGNEERVISDIEKKAPHLRLALREENGRRIAVQTPGSLKAEDYTAIPDGPLDSIVVAAPISDVKPAFFGRFTTCKCVYVVGTPGGVNCPMPSWKDLLAAMHKLSPVLYLTPQLTRTVRFPRNYVVTNVDWNDTIKHTVWDAAVTFMARRPEFAAKYGTWGLILRLNVANALFCKDWYADVMKTSVDMAECPTKVLDMVSAYVDRHSGDDREIGAVIDELRHIGVDPGIDRVDLDARGQPSTQQARDSLCKTYRDELSKHVTVCVITAFALLFDNKQNRKMGVDEGGFEKQQPRCGYRDPEQNLNDLFGSEDAISLLQGLSLRRLTPAYDVVAMICADSALEENTDLDGGLGLLMDHADGTMGLSILTEEQRESSKHPVFMTLPQAGEGVYAVGPFG